MTPRHKEVRMRESVQPHGGLTHTVDITVIYRAPPEPSIHLFIQPGEATKRDTQLHDVTVDRKSLNGRMFAGATGEPQALPTRSDEPRSTRMPGGFPHFQTVPCLSAHTPFGVTSTHRSPEP